MRKLKKRYSPGDTRQKREFLLFPLRLVKDDNTYEIRWLEWATIEYVYVSLGHETWWARKRFVD